MSRDMEEVFRKIVETLRREYDPDKIIVFGSHARGEGTEDSDVDLFVVKASSKSQVERAREVSRLLRPRPAPLDIVVRTPSEIEERLARGDTFIRGVLQEGRVIYERG